MSNYKELAVELFKSPTGLKFLEEIEKEFDRVLFEENQNKMYYTVGQLDLIKEFKYFSKLTNLTEIEDNGDN